MDKIIQGLQKHALVGCSEHSLVAYCWIQNGKTIQKMYMLILAGIENLDINAKMRLTSARVVAF